MLLPLVSNIRFKAFTTGRERARCRCGEPVKEGKGRRRLIRGSENCAFPHALLLTVSRVEWRGILAFSVFPESDYREGFRVEGKVTEDGRDLFLQLMSICSISSS